MTQLYEALGQNMSTALNPLIIKKIAKITVVSYQNESVSSSYDGMR